MSKPFSSLAHALPALVGVLWGIAAYTGVSIVAWSPLFGFVLGAAAVTLGRVITRRYTIAAWMLTEVWILATMAVIAMGTFAILWLSVESKSWWFGLEKAEVDAVSGALVGGVTAFFATLWTKEIQDGDGFFWPSSQLQTSLRRVLLKKFVAPPPPDSKEWEAFYDYRVREGPAGWGFLARLARARIAAAYFRNAGL